MTKLIQQERPRRLRCDAGGVCRVSLLALTRWRLLCVLRVAVVAPPQVLLVGTQDRTVVGRPVIDNAKATLEVEEHVYDEKVVVFKKKRRQGYKRKQGHRRRLTMYRVTSIEMDE